MICSPRGGILIDFLDLLSSSFLSECECRISVTGLGFPLSLVLVPLDSLNLLLVDSEAML